jgi:hypothetical protein
VKLSNGETWTARVLSSPATSAGADLALDTGSPVVVTAIEGSTAFVAPAERS